MIQGYWIPVLHSHLPFVKHPQYENFFEEHWLFEAITECYIPLLQRLAQLESKNIPFALTVSITPPLAEMLDDANLMAKYLVYLNKLIELGSKEVVRTQEGEYAHIALFYYNMFVQTKEFFVGFLEGNVLSGYRHFYDRGNLEIITCGATHGYLPLLKVNEKAVEVQIQVATLAHQKHFGRKPKGIWLPECAYYEGLDAVLQRYEIEFFILDAHGLALSDPTSPYGVYAPVKSLAGVCAFGRDNESSRQVWSSKEGYPGDFCYRDFYRDIGYDLDFEYIKNYINPDGTRVFTGFKYHKITGDTEHKEIYDPYIAFEKTKEHAANFHFNRVKQVEYIANLMDRLPSITSPYDAELFGHWWFEGPEFLFNVFQEIDKHQSIKALTPLQYLSMYPTNHTAKLHPSSWGANGYYEVWLNESNDWIYRHLHEMADVMCECARKYMHVCDASTQRVLNQMARELLLAQSSDWAFLMTTATATEYSTARTKEHIYNFWKLHNMVLENHTEIDFLEEIEIKNSIFDFIDFRVYS